MSRFRSDMTDGKKLGTAVFASTLNTHDDAAKHAYR
jgi:hypothetical protein